MLLMRRAFVLVAAQGRAPALARSRARACAAVKTKAWCDKTLLWADKGKACFFHSASAAGGGIMFF